MLVGEFGNGFDFEDDLLVTNKVGLIHLLKSSSPVSQEQWLFRFRRVSVTPSTTVRAGGNVVGEFHDICCGGGWTNFKPGRTGSGAGIAGASRVVVGGVRPQRDERSKVRAVRGDQILNARLLAPKPASSPTAGKVVAKSRRGHRSWQEHWGVD